MRITNILLTALLAISLFGCAPSSAPATVPSPTTVVSRPAQGGSAQVGGPGYKPGQVPGAGQGGPTQGGPGGMAGRISSPAQPTSSGVPEGQPGDVRVSEVDGAEMVYVPGGNFQPLSGRPAANLRGFWIDKTEVTNEQYRKFMEAGGYQKEEYWDSKGWSWVQDNHIAQPLFWEDPRYNDPKQPVVGVSWFEASAYAKWAGKRLPTEYEWEAAARGTDKRQWPWGSEWDKTRADSYDGSAGKPVPVGSYPAGASPYGVLDMAGNVWEWTADWYQWRPMGRTTSDPEDKELKGSSWDTGFGQDQRCMERRGRGELRYPSGGFRTAQ